MMKKLYLETCFTKYKEKKEVYLPIYIISTGSKYNSVYFTTSHILIDLGLPFKKYSDDVLRETEVILLTHKHGDHLNIATLKKWINLYPKVTVYAPPPLYKHLKEKVEESYFKNIKEFLFFHTINVGEWQVTATPTKHGDITNVAYSIYRHVDQTHILYATDLEYAIATPFQNQKYNLPNNRYNMILLEANYNKEDLDEAFLDQDLSYRASSNLRHLDEESAWFYIQTHLTEEGLFIPLHPSLSFGRYHYQKEVET